MPKTTKKSKTTEETIKATGETLLKTVKDLIAQGNIRKITIKDKNGKSIAEFPLTIGVVAAAIVPVLAAIGALAALIGECTISVERTEK
ncbi:MAG TPA: DUF4342 domain-containing protein [Patescibacteria group bacterium]